VGRFGENLAYRWRKSADISQLNCSTIEGLVSETFTGPHSYVGKIEKYFRSRPGPPAINVKKSFRISTSAPC